VPLNLLIHHDNARIFQLQNYQGEITEINCINCVSELAVMYTLKCSKMLTMFDIIRIDKIPCKWRYLFQLAEITEETEVEAISY